MVAPDIPPKPTSMAAITREIRRSYKEKMRQALPDERAKMARQRASEIRKVFKQRRRDRTDRSIDVHARMPTVLRKKKSDCGTGMVNLPAMLGSLAQDKFPKAGLTTEEQELLLQDQFSSKRQQKTVNRELLQSTSRCTWSAQSSQISSEGNRLRTKSPPPSCSVWTCFRWRHYGSAYGNGSTERTKVTVLGYNGNNQWSSGSAGIS